MRRLSLKTDDLMEKCVTKMTSTGTYKEAKSVLINPECTIHYS